MSGRFSAYKIDRCYINTNNENIFLEIIQLISICIVWFMINYIHYKLLTMEDNPRLSWKKRVSIIFFWLIEMLFVGFAILALSNINFTDLLNCITVGDVVEFLFVLFQLCFLINLFAIEFWIEQIIEKHKKKKSHENIKQNERNIKGTCLCFIAIVAFELILIFLMAYKTELNRSDYKIIMIQMDEKDVSDSIIEYGKDGKKYEMYPIVYENEDLYIVTRIFKHNGKIGIDYNYQRIVEKEGQEILYIENIYDIQ